MIEHAVTIESDASLPDSVTSAAITSLVNHVLCREEIDSSWEIGIRFVDDPTMQQAHLDYMGIDEPTDIMTFPYEDDADEWDEGQSGGDLLISVETAAINAADAGWTHQDELYFVVIHGLLHLTGWDDLTEPDRARMHARQHELLVAWKSES